MHSVGLYGTLGTQPDPLAQHGDERVRLAGGDAHLPGHDHDDVDDGRHDCPQRNGILLVPQSIHHCYEFHDQLHWYKGADNESKEEPYKIENGEWP